MTLVGLFLCITIYMRESAPMSSWIAVMDTVEAKKVCENTKTFMKNSSAVVKCDFFMGDPQTGVFTHLYIKF